VKHLAHTYTNVGSHSLFTGNVLQIVFTKVDLTSKQELYASLGQAFSVINSSMGGACLPFIPTLSTVDKTGLDHFKLTMGEIYGQKWDF